MLGLTAIFLISLWLYLSWHNVRQLQLQRMAVAVSLAANHSQSYFDTKSAQLEGLAALIQQKDGLKRPSVMLGLLENFKIKHAELGGATLIHPSGQMLASTA